MFEKELISIGLKNKIDNINKYWIEHNISYDLLNNFFTNRLFTLDRFKNLHYSNYGKDYNNLLYELKEYSLYYYSILSIKNKNRVKENSEVYTPSDIVIEMINTFEQTKFMNSIILEPTCGNGNIIIAIIIKKFFLLYNQTNNIYTSIYNAVNTTFGLDILEDNIEETQYRIFEFCKFLNIKDNNLLRLKCIIYNNIKLTNNTLIDMCNNSIINWPFFELSYNTIDKTLFLDERIKILNLIKEKEFKNNNIIFTDYKDYVTVFKDIIKK